MLTDEILIEKAKKLVEAGTGWGDSSDWTNKDFVELSQKIEDRTGVMVSHVTLKRIWGKVKYDSLPNVHTLDTIVKFTGYENWRDFKLKNGNGKTNGDTVAETAKVDEKKQDTPPVKEKKYFSKKILFAAGIIVLPCLLFFFPREAKNVVATDYSFSSKTIVSQGLPNTVVFDVNATKSPFDSVSIQQSWDRSLRVNVSKNERQHTAIYYYPDYFQAKLIVGNKVVKEHDLLIKTDGWLSLVEQSPVPLYFSKEDAISNGKMGLSADLIQSKNINMQPTPPHVMYANVKDFGDIYSDDFVFETSLKNDFNEGAAVCQDTRVFLLCQGTAIWIPLSAKGCVSDLDIFFTKYQTSGKQEDLSAFGVDFSKFVKLRIECKKGKAVIMVNDKQVYAINDQIVKSKIIGIMYRFQGTGSVDYVKLSNEKVNYDEEF